MGSIIVPLSQLTLLSEYATQVSVLRDSTARVYYYRTPQNNQVRWSGAWRSKGAALCSPAQQPWPPCGRGGAFVKLATPIEWAHSLARRTLQWSAIDLKRLENVSEARTFPLGLTHAPFAVDLTAGLPQQRR